MPIALDYADPVAYRNGGTCSQCNRADRLVGLDFIIDYEGSVALCRGCLADAAMAAGLIVTEDGARRLAEAESRAGAAELRANDSERLLAQVQSAVQRIKNLPKPARS